MGDCVYIIVTNYNLEDFQSRVIKYKSWNKFIEDIQDISFMNVINGTLTGLLHPRNAVAAIDFKDNFHAKYHFDSPLFRDCFSYAYLVENQDMDYVYNFEKVN